MIMSSISRVFMTIIDKITGKSASEKIHALKNQFTSEMLNVQSTQRQTNKRYEQQTERLDQTADRVYRATQGELHAIRS